MDELLTVLGLGLVTAGSMWWHVRRTACHVKPAPARRERCARCRTPLEESASECGGCGAPRQVFELAAAPAAAGAPVAQDPTARAHAVVRADVCAGCGTCVAACPEQGAIRLEAKLAVVDLARCVGHGDCAAACPVGAIAVGTGDAVQRVEVPHVSANFETNIPGLYVVGELGGRGLIKNAVNEGKVAAEHVGRMLPPGQPRADGRTDAWDLVIVGSGPAGLSAGLEAHRLGLRYAILEQGTLADTVRKYPRHKLLFAEPLRVPLYGDLWVSDASKESLLTVWETIVRTTGLNVVTNRRVEALERTGDVFALVAGPETWFARRVILALGRRGTPRRLEVPGEEMAKVVYDIAEMEDFARRRVLVVGGGDSAIESAVGLAHQDGTTVHLSYRGADFGRAKARNREKLAAQVEGGRIHLLLKSEVQQIEPARVLLTHEGQPVAIPNDDVVVRIGGEAPYAFLERIGVGIVAKDLPRAGEASVA